MLKINLQFFAKDNSDSYNDRIDSAKQAYDTAKAKGDTAGMEKAHAEANAVRAEAEKAGYVAGNYVSTSSNKKTSKIDTSNYSDDYDVATNYYRPIVEEEPKINNVNNSTGFNDTVNAYAQAMKNQNEANINKSYNELLNQISKSEDTARQTAKNNRDVASVRNQLQNAKLNRWLNDLGIANSGTSAQMNINQAGALQNNLSNITSDETKQLAELQNQRNQAKVNRDYDINSTNAGIDAQMLASQANYLQQKELAQMGYDNQAKLQQQQLNYEYIWDDTLGRYVSPSLYATTHNLGATYSTSGGSGSSVDYGKYGYGKDFDTWYDNYVKNFYSVSPTGQPLSAYNAYNTLFNPQITDIGTPGGDTNNGNGSSKEETSLTYAEKILKAFGF